MRQSVSTKSMVHVSILVIDTNVPMIFYTGNETLHVLFETKVLARDSVVIIKSLEEGLHKFDVDKYFYSP